MDGFSQDVLSVNLTCEKCDCQDVEINSKECWKRGNLACGGCECQKGVSMHSEQSPNFASCSFLDLFQYAGRNCECDLSQIGGDFNIQCKNPNTGQLCNGNGNCKCGICNCNFNYLGRQCECKIDKCLSKDLKVWIYFWILWNWKLVGGLWAYIKSVGFLRFALATDRVNAIMGRPSVIATMTTRVNTAIAPKSKTPA